MVSCLLPTPWLLTQVAQEKKIKVPKQSLHGDQQPAPHTRPDYISQRARRRRGRAGGAGRHGGRDAEPRRESGGVFPGHRRHPGAALQRHQGLRLPQGWDAQQGDPGGPREGLRGRLPGEPALRQPRPGVSSGPGGGSPGGRGGGPGVSWLLSATGGFVFTPGESFRQINAKTFRFILLSSTGRVTSFVMFCSGVSKGLNVIIIFTWFLFSFCFHEGHVGGIALTRWRCLVAGRFFSIFWRFFLKKFKHFLSADYSVASKWFRNDRFPTKTCQAGKFSQVSVVAQYQQVSFV